MVCYEEWNMSQDPWHLSAKVDDGGDILEVLLCE